MVTLYSPGSAPSSGFTVVSEYFPSRITPDARWPPGSAGWNSIVPSSMGFPRTVTVTVLGAPEVATVALGVLQERDEVRDPDDVDPGLDPVVVVRLHGQRHEAAVRAAGHPDASLVEVGLLGDPVKESADVLDGVGAE